MLQLTWELASCDCHISWTWPNKTIMNHHHHQSSVSIQDPGSYHIKSDSVQFSESNHAAAYRIPIIISIRDIAVCVSALCKRTMHTATPLSKVFQHGGIWTSEPRVWPFATCYEPWTWLGWTSIQFHLIRFESLSDFIIVRRSISVYFWHRPWDCLALSIAVTRWPAATSSSPQDVDPLEEYVTDRQIAWICFFLWLPVGKLILEKKSPSGHPASICFLSISWQEDVANEEAIETAFADAIEEPACPEALLDLFGELAVDDAVDDDDDDADVKSAAAAPVSKRKLNTRGTSSINDDDTLDSTGGIIKAPLFGEITRQGNQVYCGTSPCGSISYLLHWRPPATSATCTVHPDCYVTAPIEMQDDILVRWLGEAYCYRNAADHGKFSPSGCYHRRRPPARSSSKWN